MAHQNNFDVTGVVTDWLSEQGLTPLERAALLNELQDGVKHNNRVKQLIVFIAEQAAEQKLSPVNAIAMAYTYGAALGVLLERHRNGRVLA